MRAARRFERGTLCAFKVRESSIDKPDARLFQRVEDFLSSDVREAASVLAMLSLVEVRGGDHVSPQMPNRYA
jgi:hypothetical protein